MEIQEPKNITIEANITSAIKNDKLIIFVGSGLSKIFNLPDWNNLVIDVIKEINDEKLKLFIPILEQKLLDPIEVLEKLKNEKDIIHKYLKENFVLKSENDFSLHKKILALTSKIITTNYDNAFEKTDNTISTVLYNSPFNINEIKNEKKFIFKLHGCAKSDASKCILFHSDYLNLYSSENAAILKLKDLFINNTILFIGFGFNDPYVNLVFNNLNKIFEGYNKHYLLTTTPKNFDSLPYIKPIHISDYKEINSFIEKMLVIKNERFKNIHQLEGLTTKYPVNRTPKIAFLYPEPVDLPLNQNFSKSATYFDNLEVEIYKGYLNLKSLQLLDDFELVFIITSSYKNKIYIEGEDLKSELITIEELDRNIPNEKTIRVIVTDEDININQDFSIIHLLGYKASNINKLIFKALRNNDLCFKEKEINIYNIDSLPFKIEKGRPKFLSLYDIKRPLEFLPKASISIIGRVEEQSIIANRILKIIESNKLLNIKGSGGLGKTTLIKKIGYELYNRGYFDFGVSFISCENINSYADFEEELTKGFKLKNIINFREYLFENSKKINLLIILDNFETVSNLSNKEDYRKVISLLEFATDYANIVITSRESLLVDFEDIFTLGTLITDDALNLFKNNYQGNVKESEEKILRSDILENLLNNNPLAIKLVTKTNSQHKNISELRDQLKEHFFEATSEEFESIFKKNVDLNIERTRSIFQSINYSYHKLTTKQKLAFELLHLFPDGISLTNFKKWFNKQKSSSNNISDLELKQLQDKSLVENYDGTLQLQPIIRRFAEFHFIKRTKDIKAKYYIDAYDFNTFQLEYIDFVDFRKSTSFALFLNDSIKNNLLLVLDYLPHIEISEKSIVSNKIHLLNFIDGIMSYIVNESQINAFRRKLNDIKNLFTDIPNADIYLNVISTWFTYYFKDFNSSYEELRNIFPPEEIEKRIFENEDHCQREYRNIISYIHSMEGYTINYIQSFVTNRAVEFLLDTHFYYLGVFTPSIRAKKGFYNFEIEFILKTLNLSELENYINLLFPEQHLERMQCTYILSKVKFLEKEDIKKLVITNPYTKGLKELMYAFISEDHIIKIQHFEKALKNLYHIKYYYLEALYFFCEYLTKINDPLFEYHYRIGLELSAKYYYQHLEFKFKNILDPDKFTYICNFEYYPIEGLEQFFNDHKKLWESEFKKKVEFKNN
ncbi:SIR2 family protein [Adhaeribacter swui]|uniref:SIR2 family protein n=1 Tax=Adhaeribacter swui TaxID=2086471 RepID=A0A7G7GA23_9BACT|nr:SIR2 family protein [Adhaeribacter swui]QNF34007.1 SIR2 family protein [Adhaeribacter swui]